jgi:hypothetical protein
MDGQLDMMRREQARKIRALEDEAKRQRELAINDRIRFERAARPQAPLAP